MTDLFRPQFGEAHHRAYVVEDIEGTIQRLVDQLGAGPFFLIEGVPLENVHSRGEPAEFAHNSAFGACGGGDVIELIQAVSLAPGRVEERFSGPLPRIHHVAYILPPRDVAAVRSSLDEQGLAQYLSSQFGGVETTLHDASALLGHDIEIHVDNDGLHGFFGMGAAPPRLGTARNRCAASSSDGTAGAYRPRIENRIRAGNTSPPEMAAWPTGNQHEHRPSGFGFARSGSRAC